MRDQAHRKLAAAVFRGLPAAEGIKVHPELASAYGWLAELDKKTKTDGLSEVQRAVVRNQFRQDVAAAIERGGKIKARVREQGPPAAPVQRDRGKERDLER